MKKRTKNSYIQSALQGLCDNPDRKSFAVFRPVRGLFETVRLVWLAKAKPFPPGQHLTCGGVKPLPRADRLVRCLRQR